MTTPSNFIKLTSTSVDEVMAQPETEYTVSWKGYVDQITKSDIKHLLDGKPLLLVVDDEYNVVIKLVD
ncbi:hypothetical protein [Limosilactobacillus oris]|uniref:Uncharacterized protein n=1 Tax=Lactobacillus crispatus TaxID=47770 RepID=A0A921FJX6_9LACO|nr:hypothetical protein [Limosilactobacillus oris]HJF10515.1 hypothetical protein [Lactobacillus crispatus]